MFFKRKPLQYITKLFVTVNPDEQFDFEWIAARLFPFCREAPTEYSINYRRNRPIKKLGTTNREYLFKDIESVFFWAAGGSVLTIGIGGAPFGTDNARRIFHFDVEHHAEQRLSTSELLINTLAEKLSLQYAYARSLPGNFSTFGETRIRHSLFGMSFKVEQASKTWLLPPQEILDGAIKGIYPVNYWREGVFDRLRRAGIWLPDRITGNGIVVINAVEGAEIAKRNTSHKQFIHLIP